MAAYTSHSHDRPQKYVAIYRRPPYTIRRTATSVLAGNYGWHEPDDLLALQAVPSPSPALSASLPLPTPVLAAPQPPIVLRDTNIDNNTQLGGRRAAKAPRGKGKTKAILPERTPVDMGVSIIPICAPGTGTPSPSPEPPSPPPHPHPRRPPPASYASTSSSISNPIVLARRSDFEAGAQRVAGAGAAAATVGKRSRGPSQSQRQRHPISPPVTSPNTSQSELPPGPSNGVGRMASAPASAPAKRTREGREAPRRKRRKTESRGEAVAAVMVPASVPASAPAHGKEQSGQGLDAAVRRPAQRKGWKGWVMVSDTEGSDADRPNTPPVTILEKKTRSGRDFDQEGQRVTRRGRSTVSVGAESAARSTAPPSSVVAT
ncbi:hypothetical protein BDV93DRAFT_523889 [Ceratobasidium sp. AG-I]|nr:hypothetical protein BDV93DRAFT_523889 [Ceratobasidium sp. AG-I]